MLYGVYKSIFYDEVFDMNIRAVVKSLLHISMDKYI